MLLQDSVLVLHEDKPLRLSVDQPTVNVGMTILSFTLKVYDVRGEFVGAAESLAAVPVISATADWVAATGIILLTQAPARHDSLATAGQRAGIGSYTVITTVFDEDSGRTLDLDDDPAMVGQLVVRFSAPRPPLDYFKNAGRCGCGSGGRSINAGPCGCGSSTEPHAGSDGLFTRRARIRGTWKGNYDPAVNYPRGSVVTAAGTGRNWIKVCS